MAKTINGGVTIINTLTTKNDGEYPLVMAESVETTDGKTLEELTKNAIYTLESDSDILDDETNDTEINDKVVSNYSTWSSRKTTDTVYDLEDTLQEQIDTLNSGGVVLKDSFIKEQISTWLTDHPDATTTVQDKSVSKDKLTDELSKNVTRSEIMSGSFFYDLKFEDGSVMNSTNAVDTTVTESKYVTINVLAINKFSFPYHALQDSNGDKVYFYDKDDNFITKLTVPSTSAGSVNIIEVPKDNKIKYAKINCATVSINDFYVSITNLPDLLNNLKQDILDRILPGLTKVSLDTEGKVGLTIDD